MTGDVTGREADPGALFEPGGLLSASHPSYEHRPGQSAMARAVGGAIEDGRRLMVEAGTGTGKTLAYLVPAILSGRRVIVSTGTRNLQDQIHRHDLPFLRDRLGLDFSACVMKGRDNYLCRYRLAQFAHEPMFQDLREKDWIQRIVDWGGETASGDRAELADMPDDLKMWRDVNARAETCTGTKCPEYEDCWLTRVKREAQESQIVVVNHHLFFADLALRSAYGAVLPDYDTVVFDEAHLLEEVATLYFGTQVSIGMLEDLARTAEGLAAKAGGPVRGGCGAGALREAIAEFFDPLRDRLRHAKGRIRFEPVERGGPDLEVEWAVLSNALDEVVRQAALFRAPRIGGPAASDDADSLTQRVRDVHKSLARVLDRRDPAFVYGVEQRGRRSIVLTAAPIDVSESLREVLFDPLHAAVLTSATMAVEGKFDFFRDRLGVDDADTLVVDSSFDHATQALLYLPPRMPEPRDREFVPRCVDEIVRSARGDGGAGVPVVHVLREYAPRARSSSNGSTAGRCSCRAQGSRAALVESNSRKPRARCSAARRRSGTGSTCRGTRSRSSSSTSCPTTCRTIR